MVIDCLPTCSVCGCVSCACGLSGFTTAGTSVVSFCAHCSTSPCICPRPVATGWLCPKCGRGVAPHEKTCDHGTETGFSKIGTIEPITFVVPLEN